jgi:hypothetical protein
MEETEKAEWVLVVSVDRHSDPNSTIVELSQFGTLLDTTKALKNLGWNVLKALVSAKEGKTDKNKFYITRSINVNKVENSKVLEAITLTIINNLLKYHPVSNKQFYMGETFGASPSKEKLDMDIATTLMLKK